MPKRLPFKLTKTQKVVWDKIGQTTTILDDMNACIQKRPLTKRARRQAKKLFPKQRHTPWGYTRYGHYQKPELPPNVKAWLFELDTHALNMFRKPYHKLKSVQQSKIFEDMNTQGPRETVHYEIIKCV